MLDEESLARAAALTLYGAIVKTAPAPNRLSPELYPPPSDGVP
jgi:hypothetical protein